MAGFNIRALTLLSSMNYFPQAGSNPNIFTYGTTDALATILTDGYFNTARDKGKIKVNDIIIGMANAGGVGVPFSIKFTTVPGSGNVVSALVDLASGAAGGAGHGIQVLPFFFNLAEIAANGDLLTNYVPGYNFKIEKVDWRQSKAVTTTAKLATINIEINTTDLTGGVVALTSAACTPAGVAVAGTAVTANNVGGPTDSFSIEASGVTAFAEGSGWLLISLRNLDG
ncbi:MULTISPECIES: hypothetical protein [unclassified Mesorhizobium]|uniref:hypothetical protein n=1 Tax=unclassified Mesorhizobium TaxID=325217 RepID=UPI0010918DA2|nr:MULTISPECIES: hypothetical protein [unclassified Mesorhizobium]TGP93839.1 hypothetical protein EN861_17275 [Mesorhizobium sp. M8A.F.Ca.ET.218.01.1.1]TGT18135.1 hypothetical protein EN856_16800 [Mesorhizobium sp. M8A.F.Ca.ET.213.01.1.1]